MHIKDVMTREVATVSANESAERAWTLMKTRAIHHLVVKDGSDVTGVLSDRDLGGARGARRRDGRRVVDLMTPRVVSVTPSVTVRRAANLLRGHDIGCLPVVDKGRLVGLVTVSDLLELIGRGAERPVERGERWTLRHRGQERKRARGARGGGRRG